MCHFLQLRYQITQFSMKIHRKRYFSKCREEEEIQLGKRYSREASSIQLTYWDEASNNSQ